MALIEPSPALEPDAAPEESLTAEEEDAVARVDALVTVRSVYRLKVSVAGPTVPAQATGPDVWKQFPLQQQAFDFADFQARTSGRQDLRVFSQEGGPKGRRHFLATNLGAFWKRYQDMQPQDRHCYEIIRSGRACHLYFDLEYDVSANPGVDGDAQVDLLVQEVAHTMKAWLGVQIDPSRHVIELDSTTRTKFSRHLTVQLRRAWRHNGHVHAYIERLVQHLSQRRQEEEDATLASEPVSTAACIQPGSSDTPTIIDLTTFPGHPAPAAADIPTRPPAATSRQHARYRHFWVRKPATPMIHTDTPQHETVDGPQAGDAESGSACNAPPQLQCSETLMLDTGVYTRNRAFRVYLSSKFGKHQVLRATRRYATAHLLTQHAQQHQEQLDRGRELRRGHKRAKSDGGDGRSAALGLSGAAGSKSDLFSVLRQCDNCGEEVDMTEVRPPVSVFPPERTAAAHVLPAASDRNSTLDHDAVTLDDANAQRPCSSRVGSHSQCLLLSRGEEEALQDALFWRSLVTHTSQCQGVKPIVMFPEEEAERHTGAVRVPNLGLCVPPPEGLPAASTNRSARGFVSTGTGATGTGHVTQGVTPWPSLNQYVERMCDEIGGSGSVGSWMLAGGCSQTLLLNIKGHRWCGRVGRQHKSNGVYWAVDVNRGVWAQKCFDPECREYRSPSLPLPVDVWQVLQAELQRHTSGTSPDAGVL